MRSEPLARNDASLPGITVRSVFASVFAMVLMAVLLVLGETIEGNGWFYGMHILAVPAVLVFLGLFLLAAVLYRLFRIRLLTRSELTCVFFSLLVAVPIMGMGFWTNFIWLSSTIPAQGDFEKIDAISDKLWPHGPNLLEGLLSAPQDPAVKASNGVEWREVEYEEGALATLPVLNNKAPGDISWVRLRAPVEKDGEAFLTLGERYLASVLVRGRDLGADAVLSCRVYYDDHESFDVEAFTEPRPAEKVTFLHKKGFIRCGVYGLEFARSVQNHVDVEFRFSGEGMIVLADAKLMSVGAFEGLFTGRQTVSEDEYHDLRKCERTAYVMRPDSPWSWAGFKALLCGYVPIQSWRQPVGAWTAFIALLLLATFAVALIMRRQWVKNERYPLPLTRIPLALLGVDEDSEGKILPAIWRNRTLWLGFAVCFVWCLMRMWHAFNPNVPNMEIDVKLKPYFDDPGWGMMWNGVSFSVSAIVLSLAIFMELNILLSLVIGFFLFRSLHWLGEANGWALASAGKYGIGAYPYGDEQMISAYMTYALLTLIFTRKYLWAVLKGAIRGGKSFDKIENDGGDAVANERELFSYRAAFLMLLTAFAGITVWASWVGIRPQAMFVLFGAMVLIGFVAMKLRAECGTPFAWFAPGTRLLIPLAGGMAFFGASGTMFASWTSLGMILLFIIPGLQLEFVEVARRARIRARHVLGTLALGVIGGMLIGGWFFLSSLYGIGSNNAGFSYWFTARPWEFYPYIECQRVADAQIAAKSQQASVSTEGATAPVKESKGINPATWGYLGAAAATATVTILRQVFPGFWFHPIGIVLGGTADGLGMMMYWSFNLWGSLLVAWAIRLAALKLGGAATVRNRLFPFFTGVFIAAMLAQFILCGINVYLYFFDITAVRQGVVF